MDLTPVEEQEEEVVEEYCCQRGLCMARASFVPMEEKVCTMVIRHQWAVVGMGGVCVWQERHSYSGGKGLYDG